VSEPRGKDAPELTRVVTKLRRALRTSIRTDYSWESLPMAQVELLLALRDLPAIGLGDLASALRLAPSTVSGLVQRLVESGLVNRETDPGDRRATVIELSAAGREQLVDWERAHERRFGAALEALSAADRASISAAIPALNRLVDRLAASSGSDE